MNKLCINVIIIVSFLVGNADAYTSMDAKSCQRLFAGKDLSGAEFLHSQIPKLHLTFPLEQTAKRASKLKGLFLKKPAEKIDPWLNYLEDLSSRSGQDPQLLERLKDYYHKKFVTRPEDFPQSFFDTQVRLARELGHGTIVLDEKTKRNLVEVSISDQKSSLNEWLEYLVSPDSSAYPMWAKFWIFNGIVKLTNWNPETGSFGKREKGQAAPFPELNREALAIVMDAIIKKLNGKSLSDIEDPQLVTLLDRSANFEKLYGRVLLNLQMQVPLSNTTEGQWVIYKQGSDHKPLVESLRGMNTGWCTAGESTAKLQLSAGDFYVYYSLDQDGQARIPRVAIRMQGYNIIEVRGIAKGQHLDTEISRSSVVSDKLESFGEAGKTYQKRIRDMQTLTQIEKTGSLELSKEDLHFLYEVSEKIEGFGYARDPRIEEVIKIRDIKKDLARILDFKENQISLTSEEALLPNVKYHYGNLDLPDLKVAKNITLPEYVKGNLNLSNLAYAENLVLPKIEGNYNLSSLTKAKNVTFPESINGDLHLISLDMAEGVTFPKSLGNLHLFNLTSVKNVKFPEICTDLNLRKLVIIENVTFPKFIKKDLNLSGLVNAENLILPEVEGSYDLRQLKTATGVEFPKFIKGSIRLSDLVIIDGIVFPEHVDGFLDLPKVTNIKGIKLPKFIGGAFFLGIKTAKGLELPEVRGVLNLDNLETAEGLTLPKVFKGGLSLDSLKTTQGLVLPKSIGKDLSLNGLTTIKKGFALPQSVVGSLSLNGLRSAGRVTFPVSIGQNFNLKGLTTAKGFVLPKTIGGSMHLSSLKTAKDLTFPESVVGIFLGNLETAENIIFPKFLGGWGLDLSKLTSFKNLILPEHIEGDLSLYSLTHGEGLVLPKVVKGELRLPKLETAKGLTFPETLGGVKFVHLSSLSIEEASSIPENWRKRAQLKRIIIYE